MSPAHLTLAQAATLAGMITAPEDLNPVIEADRRAVQARRDFVLDKMLEYHWITPRSTTTR